MFFIIVFLLKFQGDWGKRLLGRALADRAGWVIRNIGIFLFGLTHPYCFVQVTHLVDTLLVIGNIIKP